MRQRVASPKSFRGREGFSISTPIYHLDGRLSIVAGSPGSDKAKLTFSVSAVRIDAHGSLARTKHAEVILDTDLKGRADAFNPAELLLAALAACIIKGVERVSPTIGFHYDGLAVRIEAVRQDVPPRMESIQYEVIVDTDEKDERLELLHQNIKRFGTVFNTIAPGTELTGSVRRGERMRSAAP